MSSAHSQDTLTTGINQNFNACSHQLQVPRKIPDFDLGGLNVRVVADQLVATKLMLPSLGRAGASGGFLAYR